MTPDDLLATLDDDDPAAFLAACQRLTDGERKRLSKPIQDAWKARRQELEASGGYRLRLHEMQFGRVRRPLSETSAAVRWDIREAIAVVAVGPRTAAVRAMRSVRFPRRLSWTPRTLGTGTPPPEAIAKTGELLAAVLASRDVDWAGEVVAALVGTPRWDWASTETPLATLVPSLRMLIGTDAAAVAEIVAMPGVIRRLEESVDELHIDRDADVIRAVWPTMAALPAVPGVLLFRIAATAKQRPRSWGQHPGERRRPHATCWLELIFRLIGLGQLDADAFAEAALEPATDPAMASDEVIGRLNAVWMLDRPPEAAAPLVPLIAPLLASQSAAVVKAAAARLIELAKADAVSAADIADDAAVGVRQASGPAATAVLRLIETVLKRAAKAGSSAEAWSAVQPALAAACGHEGSRQRDRAMKSVLACPDPDAIDTGLWAGQRSVIPPDTAAAIGEWLGDDAEREPEDVSASEAGVPDDLLARVAALPPAIREATAFDRCLTEDDWPGWSTPPSAIAVAPLAEPLPLLKTIEEIADELLTFQYEGGGQTLGRLERVLDGLSRLADRNPDDLGPVAASLYPSKRDTDFGTRSVDAFHVVHFDDAVHRLLATWRRAWTGHAKPQPIAAVADPGQSEVERSALTQTCRGPFAPPAITVWVTMRIHKLTVRMVRKVALPLLAAPTHTGGWLDPPFLAQRLLAYAEAGEQIDEEELTVALLRLMPERRDEAAAAIGPLPAAYREAGDAVRIAAGVDPLGEVRTIWRRAAEASRSDVEALAWPAIEPDTSRRVLAIDDPPGVKEAVEPLALTMAALRSVRDGAWHGDFSDEADKQAIEASIIAETMPHQASWGVLLLAARSMHRLLRGSGLARVVFTQPLCGAPWRQWGEAEAYLGLGGLLSDPKRPDYAATLAAVSDAIAADRTRAADWRLPLAKLLASGGGSRKRLVAALAELSTASPTHADFAADLLDAAAVATITQPGGLAGLLDRLLLASMESGRCPSNALVAALETLSGKGKAATLAGKIIALEPDAARQDGIRRQRLTARLVLAERLISY